MRHILRIAVSGTMALLLWMGMIHVHPLFAQSSTLTVATTYQIPGGNIRQGMLVSNSGNTIQLAQGPQDDGIFGVITENPAISLGRKDQENAYPVTTAGTVRVLVSNANGPIRRGDYISASNEPGVGMRASIPSRVVGRAVDEFTSDTPNAIGMVLTFVTPEQVTAQMLKSIDSLDGKVEDYEPKRENLIERNEFITYVKLISSGLIAVIAFAGGIAYYIQISKKEIEALGRNPLASKTIRGDMVKHGIVVILICLGGLAMAFFILRI